MIENCKGDYLISKLHFFSCWIQVRLGYKLDLDKSMERGKEETFSRFSALE